MAKITYQDKENINTLPSVPANNKVRDIDMNEIKVSVNDLYDILEPIADVIIEKGSNTNGHYIKYESGRMVQFGKLTVNSAIQTAMGSVYRTNSAQIQNYPKSFIELPYVYTQAKAALQSFYVATENNSYFEGYPICYTSTSAASRYIWWLAIGKWK